MTEYSKAYKDCGAVFARGGALIFLYVTLHHLSDQLQHKIPNQIESQIPRQLGIRIPRPRLTDLVRSAVVLCVSAMDAYYSRRFVEMLVPFVKKKGLTTGLEELLKNAGLDVKQAIEIATMERPWRRIRTLVQRHLERRTTQNFKVIDDLFLCFGIKNFTASAEAMAGRRALLRSVQKLVERRHKIVHEGDMDRHGRLRVIDAGRISSQLDKLGLLIRNSEKLLNQRLS